MKINNNIEEDYCSFEVSNLLKEKGFDVHCTYFYNEGSGWRLQSDSIIKTGSGDWIHCPTHALAIKWIRENFGIHIWINCYGFGYYWIIGNTPNAELRNHFLPSM